MKLTPLIAITTQSTLHHTTSSVVCRLVTPHTVLLLLLLLLLAVASTEKRAGRIFEEGLLLQQGEGRGGERWQRGVDGAAVSGRGRGQGRETLLLSSCRSLRGEKICGEMGGEAGRGDPPVFSPVSRDG